MANMVTMRRSCLLISSVLVLGLVVSACGNGGSSAGSTSSTAPSPATAAVLGPKKTASGVPYKVGMAYDSGGQAIDATGYKTAGQATEQYINEHLGGIDGRPLQIVFCETAATTAGATACANSFVQDKVNAFLTVTLAEGDAVAGAANAAGIPYVALTGASTKELTGATSFSLTGAIASYLGAPAVAMKKEGQKSIAAITIDVPTATAAVQGLAIPAYSKAGLTMKLVAVPAGTADMTAQITSVANTDAFLVLGDTAFCTSAFQAIKTVAPGKPIYSIPQCISSSTAASIPGGYRGITTASPTRLDVTDPDYKLFQAVLAKYGASSSASNGSSAFEADGFSAVLGFARVMNAYHGDGSPASVLSYLKSGSASGALPLGGGTQMTCGKSPIAVLGSLCSVSTYLAVLGKNGTPTSYTPADPTAIFAN